jgi:two-component system, OmpR family, sensor histidine kinase VicK
MSSDDLNKKSLLSVISAIGEVSGDGIFIYSISEKKLAYVNDSLLRIFDISHPSFKQQPEFFVTHVVADDLDYLKEEFSKLMSQGRVENLEFKTRDHAGSQRSIAASAYVLDKVDMIVGFIRDITQSREHENYIINYGAKKNTLLDMVTHNLSGPLLISKNLIESLDDLIEQKDTKKIGAHVKVIKENTSHCIDIVNEFLEEEHLVSEQIYTKANRFDMVEKIESVLERCRKGFKEYTFVFRKESEQVFVSNDDVKFLQTINNLLSNAVKWSPSGSTIEVRLQETTHDVLLVVSDSGVGIPEKVRPYIFQRHSLASRPGLKGEKSIGMGLYIVKKLVSLMQGEIWFESKLNAGTTFFVRLPKDLR